MQWVDPVVAARVTQDFNNGHAVSLMGDVGGFNAESDFSWQVLVNYEREGTFLGFDTTTSIGYRALGLLFAESTSRARGG